MYNDIYVLSAIFSLSAFIYCAGTYGWYKIQYYSIINNSPIENNTSRELIDSQTGYNVMLTLNDYSLAVADSQPPLHKVFKELSAINIMTANVITQAIEEGDGPQQWSHARSIIFDSGLFLRVDWLLFMLAGDSLEWDDDEEGDEDDCVKFAHALSQSMECISPPEDCSLATVG